MTESLRSSDSFLCWLVVGSVFSTLCCAFFPFHSLSLYNIIKVNCVICLPLNYQTTDCFQTGSPCFLQIYSCTKHRLQSKWVAWVYKHTVFHILNAYKISKTIDISDHIFCISLTVSDLIVIADFCAAQFQGRI